MKRLFWAVALLLCIGVSAYAQTSAISGTVSDPTNALIPGVTITVTNTATGVAATALTNDSGTYTFVTLPAGPYKITGALQGFQTASVNNITLGAGDSQRFNMTLKVATGVTTVDVAVDASTIISQASSSVGDVLTAEKIHNLPLVGNDVMNLLDILPGLRLSPLGNGSNTIGGLSMDTINATRDGMTMNDGRYSSALYGYGVFSSTTINPDLVGEIKLILAPVDAELGRGNSQIQISTRSGTNKYTGRVVWNIQNTALNSNTWGNNNDTVNGVWTPTKPDWRNTHQITASYGGPIMKGKTFFFFLYDQTINNTRETQTVNVMSEAARQGVFRYFTGWNPGAFQSAPTATPTTSTNPNYPSVNDVGFPVAPLVNPDGTAYSGGLRCFSVFGPKLLNGTTITPGAAAASDPYCPGGTWVTNGANAWDPTRPNFDASGYIRRVIDLMPHANRFQGGDGLNQAQFRWLRTREGSNSNPAIVGADAYSNRKQYNIKLDHNFNAKHKVSASSTYQQDDSADNVSQWPGGLNGSISRRPIVLTINGTSTLSSTLLNEARFGMNHNKTASGPAWLSPNAAIAEEAQTWLLSGGVNPLNGKTYPVVLTPTVGNYGFAGNGYIATAPSQIGNTTPLYNFADTLSWTMGRHALKFGIELRLPRTNGYNIQPYPTVSMGNNGSATNTVSPFTTLTNFSSQLPTFRSNTRANAANMSYFLAGSVNSASQQYWIENADNVKNGVWDDTTTQGNRYREQVSQEWAGFVKDDFKITKRVTLNLGLRYEYYGSPYLRSGLTSAPVGLGEGMFGASRGAGGAMFDNYLSPGNLFLSNYGSTLSNGFGIPAGTAGLVCASGKTQSALLPVSNCDPNLQTTIQFIGPNSPNPNLTAIPLDKNNFGPAIGFAWQVPWFGEGKTSVRGGYQVTFGQAGRDGITLDGLLGSAPGNSLTQGINLTDAKYACIVNGTLCPDGSLNPARALNIGDIPALVPVRPSRAPGQTVPIYGRSVGFTAYDPNFRTPYTQNLTMSITRNFSRNITLDIRYVATLARKQSGNFQLNDSTVFYNKELFDALTIARAGGESPLLDQMLAGLNLNSALVTGATVPLYGPVGTSVLQPAGTPLAGQTILQTGAAHLRRSGTFAGNLANGDFEAVANSLVGLAPTGLQAVPIDPATGIGMTGVNLRTVRNGCDRIANGLYNPAMPASATNIPTRCFPENYLTSNNQFTTAQFNANLGRSNYHSLQIGTTLRPLTGISIQTTYSFAKSMQLAGSGYWDPLQRNLDYARGREGPHSVRMNGTIELPLGPNKLLFGSSSGLMARLIERWQTSFIFNAATGSPADILGATNHRYGGARMVVASDLWQIPQGEVEWGRNNNTVGSFYGDPSPYLSTRDPQCSSALVATTDSMGTNLQTSCTMNALGIVVPAGTPGSIAVGSRSAVLALVNSRPGEIGTLGARSLTYYGQWSLNANIGKTFRLSESKSMQVRIDTTNVLNHPVPNIPDFSLTGLGNITGKGAQTRTFQGQLSISF